jgi:hypothetical protein
MLNLLVKHSRSFSPTKLPCRPKAWCGETLVEYKRNVETGYKAFKASPIKSIELEEDRFRVESEFIAKLAQRGCR